jgi:hypothetical protein
MLVTSRMAANQGLHLTGGAWQVSQTYSSLAPHRQVSVIVRLSILISVDLLLWMPFASRRNSSNIAMMS